MLARKQVPQVSSKKCKKKDHDLQYAQKVFGPDYLSYRYSMSYLNISKCKRGLVSYAGFDGCVLFKYPSTPLRVTAPSSAQGDGSKLRSGGRLLNINTLRLRSG